MTLPSSTTSPSPSSSSVESAVSQMNTQAIRWLCEGRSEEALRLLCQCLATVKQHTPRDHHVKNENYATQVYLTEIPMEGAIGNGLYHAPETDTSFCLYEFALVVAPIQDQ